MIFRYFSCISFRFSSCSDCWSTLIQNCACISFRFSSCSDCWSTFIQNCACISFRFSSCSDCWSTFIQNCAGMFLKVFEWFGRILAVGYWSSVGVLECFVETCFKKVLFSSSGYLQASKFQIAHDSTLLTSKGLSPPQLPSELHVPTAHWQSDCPSGAFWQVCPRPCLICMLQCAPIVNIVIKNRLRR